MEKQTMYTLSIPTPDGEILAGYAFTLDKPALTVLLSDPYRNQTYFAEKSKDLGRLLNSNGFNYVALDVRGTGGSTGFPKDEYTEQETLDILTAIKFIKEQKWSNGEFCHYGLSYSGFTALQACVAGEELGVAGIATAFIMHASDDRWENDVHWCGGVKLLSDWLGYATAMTPFNLLPREKQGDRLENAKHPL